MQVIALILLLLIESLPQNHSLRPGQFHYLARLGFDAAKKDTAVVVLSKSPLRTEAVLEYKCSIDLNRDGFDEDFITTEGACGKGCCLWSLTDGKLNNMIGEISAWFIEVTDTAVNGFPILETSTKYGCCEAQIDFYQFDGEYYQLIQSSMLTDDSLETYARTLNERTVKMNQSRPK